MTVDPAFGLLICVPIALAALGAAIVARPRWRAVAAIAVCGVLAFVAGCGGPKQTTSTVSTPASPEVAPPPRPPAAARVSKFTRSEFEAARDAKTSGMVSVDVLDVRADGAHHDALTIASGENLHVIGWAFFEPRNVRCEAVGLLVDGKTIYPGLYGYARSDVAAFYKDASRTDVGYSIVVPAARLGTGAHSATVVCAPSRGAATRYASALQITVR